MPSPILSIFIPVYNAERYLARCLESVLAQTLSDFELYIHDDGSSDSSYEICRGYAQKDPRIVLSTGENGHFLEEINAFIDCARGKYIGFVDNDDYLDPDYFEKMIRMLEEKNADCVISSYTLVDSEENLLPWYTPELEDGLVLSREETLKRFLTTLDIEGFRWNKIYPKSVFVDHGIKFPDLIPVDINGEFELLSHINQAVLLNHHGYYYRQSSTSEMATMNPESSLRFMDTFDRIGELAGAYGLAEDGEYYRVWRRINSMFNIWKGRKGYPPSDFDRFRKACSWNAKIGKPLWEALSIVLRYHNEKENALKFAVKTLIVWGYYR